VHFGMAYSKQAVVLLALVILMQTLTVCGGQEDQEQTKKPAKADGNALCYTCHLGLQHEAITAQHVLEGVTCVSCHGPSVEHMHDEMQVTKPDRLFGRGEVNDMCSACHQGHTDVAKVEAFRDEWLGKTRPNGRVITKTSICTDCHGTHNYIIESRHSAATESPWIPLFNRRDLEGWRASDAAGWSVKATRLTAVPDPSRKRSCLVTENEYADFQLSITFRANWPVQAWVSLRQAKDTCGPSVTIGDSGMSVGRPGSIWLPERTLALANLREDTVDRLAWNTLLIEARQNQYSTWLNGEEIGRVRVDGPAQGKIAIHLAEHPANKESWLQISEIQIKRLENLIEKRNESTSGDAP
jgi:hypothetical protein